MPRNTSDPEAVRAFVSQYTTADEPAIRFARNGVHGAEYVDANVGFRSAVLDVALADIESCPIELVRDLFKAETECSLVAWGIVDGVDVLAERLLRQYPNRFIEDFLRGKFQSFDASCASVFPVDRALATDLLTITERRLAGDLSKDRRALLSQGKDLFAGWLKSA